MLVGGDRGPAGRCHDGYQAVQQLPGIGPVLAAVIVAEIGDVDPVRAARARLLLVGRADAGGHRESDTKVSPRATSRSRGRRMVRWALAGAIQRGRARPSGAPAPARAGSPAVVTRRRTSPRSPRPAGCLTLGVLRRCATGRSAACPRPPSTHHRP